jgi:predicted Zn-dependent peptidase
MTKRDAVFGLGCAVQRSILIMFCVGLFFCPQTAFPQTSDPLKDFPSRVRKVTLKNGLRLLILERPASPTVSFAMFVRTGGLDDENGKSGLAHMFEHMLFKGTKTIGTKDFEKEAPLLDRIDEAAIALQNEKDKGAQGDPKRLAALTSALANLQAQHQKLLVEEEFWKIYERAGGQDFNASTGYDFTNYVISLPVNQLKLWMAMEKDRMRNPVLREFYKERDVVLEERRQRLDNSPGGKLWEAFLSAAFVAHPYGRPILGWESDISRVTRPDAEDFFRRHYDISRLVIAVVGGINADQVEKEARLAFESISSRKQGATPRIPVEPIQDGERRVEVSFSAEPSLLMGFHRPNMTHADSAALDVAAQILGSGRTSRFNLKIIEKKKIAVSAWAGSSAPGERDPHLFVVGGAPRAPHTTRDLESALWQEIEALKKNGPTARELERVKKNLKASFISQLSENKQMADQLAYYESVAHNWKFLLQSVDTVQNVTAEDVKRVAETYLTSTNRTVATLVKKK